MPFPVNSWPSKDTLGVGFKIKIIIIIIVLLTNSLTFTRYCLTLEQISMFCFAESRLSEHISDSNVSIPGFNVMLLDLKTHKDTDLLLYFSHSINLKHVSHVEQHQIESIWIEVSLTRSKPILTGFIYRNPSERVEWFERFDSMMNAVCLEAKKAFFWETLMSIS